MKDLIFQFIFRAIPEGFLFIFAAYSFSKTAITLKDYLLSSVILTVVDYAITLLPIQYGVNTIIGLFMFIVLVVNLNKIDIIKAIQVCIISLILEFVCEGINVFIIQYVFKAEIDNVFRNPASKALYGIPSLLIFGCVAGLYYIRLLRRKELKYL